MVLEKDRLTAYLKQPLVEREKKLHNKPQSQYEKTKQNKKQRGLCSYTPNPLRINTSFFVCLFLSTSESKQRPPFSFHLTGRKGRDGKQNYHKH